MTTVEDIQTKYWAMEVLSAENQSDIKKLSGSLTSSKIDLNPHQIEAALFALNSPVSKGASPFAYSVLFRSVNITI